jgi:chitodextrinase
VDIGAHQLGPVTAPGDTQAPTAPANLRVAGVRYGSVALAWDASSDNVGVTAYRVSRDGVQIAVVTGTTFTASSLASGTRYTFTVVAVDAAGNTSPASSVSATTTAKSTKRRAT